MSKLAKSTPPNVEKPLALDNGPFSIKSVHTDDVTNLAEAGAGCACSRKCPCSCYSEYTDSCRSEVEQIPPVFPPEPDFPPFFQTAPQKTETTNKQNK